VSTIIYLEGGPFDGNTLYAGEWEVFGDKVEVSGKSYLNKIDYAKATYVNTGQADELGYDIYEVVSDE